MVTSTRGLNEYLSLFAQLITYEGQSAAAKDICQCNCLGVLVVRECRTTQTQSRRDVFVDGYLTIPRVCVIA